MQVGSLFGFKIMDTFASLNVWGKIWCFRHEFIRSGISEGCIRLAMLRNLYVILSLPEVWLFRVFRMFLMSSEVICT